jgi:hypothetical protein
VIVLCRVCRVGMVVVIMAMVMIVFVIVTVIVTVVMAMVVIRFVGGIAASGKVQCRSSKGDKKHFSHDMN